MKLNNKGFAISSIMYIILVLGVILISLILVTLSSRKLILDKLKNEVLTTIYETPNISYRQTIKQLKSEAIAYMNTNSLEKESIKIENLDSNIENEVLEKYKLNDKYLTAIENDDSYDVYLGKANTINNTTQLPKNTIDIVDYKIYGNSYQETYSGKNLFDVNKVISKFNVINNDDGTLSVTAQASSSGVGTDQILSELANLEVGKTYTLSAESTGSVKRIYLYKSKFAWNFGTSRTITQDDLDSIVYWYANGDTDTTFTAIISNIQIEEGNTATSYEPYVGGIAAPNLDYPQEVQSVGVRTNNLFNKDTIIDNTRLAWGNAEESVDHFSSDYIDCENIDVVTINLAGSFVWYDENKNVISYENKSATIFRNYVKPVDAKYLRLDFLKSVVSPEQVICVAREYTSPTMTSINAYKYKIPVKTGGKNLFNINKPLIVLRNKWDSGYEPKIENGIIYSGGKQGEAAGAMIVVPTNNNLTFTFSADTNRENYVVYYGFNEYDKDTMIATDISEPVYGQVNTTITLTQKYRYIGVCYYWENQYDMEITNLQIEYGSTPTTYEPYVESITTNIYLDEPLRKINNYNDYVSYKDKEIVRNIFEKEFNGDEKIDSYVYGLYFELKHIMGGALSSHFTHTSNQVSGSNKFSTDVNIYATHFFVTHTVDEFKAWLKEQYNKGISVKLDYVLETPSQQSIELPRITVSEGASIIEIDSDILPSNYEFTVVEKIIEI